MLIAILIALFGTGCTADRSAEAAEIRAAVPTLPGVASSNVSYINDFENGANLRIELDMTDATEAQIAAAAQRVNDLKGDAFDSHRQKTTVTVAPRAVVSYDGRLDPPTVAANSGLVRAVRAHSDAGSIRWLEIDGRSRLEVWSSADPDRDAATALAADGGPETLYIRSADPARHSSWEVTTPLSVTDFEALVRQRDRLPAALLWVGVDSGRISGLSVNLGAPATAYANLAAVIEELQPSREHPVQIEWRLDGAAPHEVGRITVCAEAADSAVPAAGFADLSDRLAAQFSACA